MAELDTYEVYAVRYSRLTKLGRENMLFCPEPLASRPMAMDYSLWAIKGASRTFVVDTGYSPEHAARLGRTFTCHPVDTLREIGIEPETASDVILSHLHYDHAGSIDRFPSATFHFHEAELPFATGWHAQEPAVSFAYDPGHVAAATRALYDKRVRLVRGDEVLAPGLELYHVPGHSPGHLCLRVWTARGWLLLAVDAAHFLLNMTMRRPFPLYLDLEQIFRGYDRLRRLQPDLNLIIGGHDASVIDRYPAAGPELAGKVARLDLEPSGDLQEG